MGSRGSVIPFFQSKKNTGILPITHKEMTRFNISLQDGVNMVLYAIENHLGGEIFVPKIPSYKILDIAEAIAPECKLEVVGIRPGEKLHEEMISKDESLNTIEYKNFYVIIPRSKYLPIDRNKYLKFLKNGKLIQKYFSYNSLENKDYLSVSQLKKILNKNTLDFEMH